MPLLGDVSLLFDARSSCEFFFVVLPWLRRLIRSFTSSIKRSDIVDEGVDTVDTDDDRMGDVNNCLLDALDTSVLCAETVEGIADVLELKFMSAALLMLVGMDRGPVVAERGAC